MSARKFGHVSEIEEGAVFRDRRALSAAGVHRPLQAGISGGQDEGAESIVVSGGYEDDEDYGDFIIYTGHGGNDPASHKQTADQELAAGNLALAKSCMDGLPVRVIRGAGGDPRHSPLSGYRYDGLYFVDAYWHETGRSGYRVWRYRLVKEPERSDPGWRQRDNQDQLGEVPRTIIEVQRQIRSTAATQAVKRLYNYSCQICGDQIITTAGPYAEGAHIRPLGRPHDGPDEPENIICLCPSDHVRFNYGALIILDDLQIVGASGVHRGTLTVAPGHAISRNCLAYHRERFASE